MDTSQLTGLARQHAASLDPKGRAELLEELARAVYEAVKFDNPEGGGFDGRDGPEREAIGRVVDMAVDYRTGLNAGRLS